MNSSSPLNIHHQCFNEPILDIKDKSKVRNNKKTNDLVRKYDK